MTVLRPRAYWVLCLGLMLALIGVWPTGAQIPGYDQLFGPDRDAQQSAPQQSRPAQSQPLQSRPAQPEPTIEDYGRIAEAVPDPMLDATKEVVKRFRTRLKLTIDRLPEARGSIEAALAVASPTGRPGYFLGIALFAGLLLVIGRAFSMIFLVYVARPAMEAMHRTERVGYVGKLPVLVYRTFLTAVALAISVVVATAVGLVFYQEHEPTLVTAIIVFTTYALVTFVDALWRVVVAPYLPEYRLPYLSDPAARSMYRWLSAVSGFAIVSMAFCYWMSALGLADEAHTAITVLLSAITMLLLILLIRVHRREISQMFLQGHPREEASWPQLVAATLWAPAVVLYLVVTWGDMSFRMVMGIEQDPFRMAVPYVIFMAGIVIYAVASYLIERAFARTREMSEINAELDAERAREEAAAAELARQTAIAADALETDVEGDGDEAGGGKAVSPVPRRTIFTRRGSSMRTLEDLARRTASLFAIGAVAYVLITYWGGPDIFDTNPALDLIQDVIDILFIGYVVFHAVRIWIDQKIAEEGGDEEPTGPMEGEGGGAGATRLATLLPLMRNFMLIVIGVSIALLVLVEMGVNVAPLFAGAGIVGLAIGFGSQTLVRDILSGAFFLMDDAFRKGEYIDVGDVKGTVEKISLRSFQLRHHLGMLHTIPFGEIQFLTNFSRDWVMMKLPLRLTYDTDVERVRKLIKKLGLRLLEDPEIGPKFIQPVKSQGVIQMDDSAMIVRVKFMTYPGEQWVLRKRIYAEVRELFEAEGIKFAHREVTVRIPDIEKKELSPDQVSAIGAAARRSVDQVEEEMLAKTGTGEVR